MNTLRARFILAYVGLIILGFAGLAGIAGRQLSIAARQDYERQTLNEVQLAARGIERPLDAYYKGQITASELDEVISAFEEQANCNLTLLLPEAAVHPSLTHAEILSESMYQYPEIESASQGKILLTERKNADGELTIYTASPVLSRRDFLGYIQLSEPASRLYQQINQRWAALGGGVALITLLSLFASIYLSTSLIRPLKKLQDSALELSRGNLAHRAPEMGTEELNKVAHAFNTMANQLQAMIEEQRAFASNTSHELRTPLTTMRLRTEALRYDKTLDEATRKIYLQELDEELLRMSSLIDDLILLSRFDAGRAQVGTDHIDFLRFAENLHRSFAAEAASRNIEFHLLLPSQGERVLQASLNHVSILFRNVLENALKYTPAGGTIRWQIHIEKDEIISVIEDTGQGIEPENLPHIFDRFFRGDKAHSREIQGTGLGLALVKAIADVYGAKIHVESAGKDQGTTVTIWWKTAVTA